MPVRRVLTLIAVVLFATFATAPAWADATYPPVGPSPSVTVKGVKVTKPVTSTGSSLPFTGADIAAVTVAGLALIAVGTVAITVARRRGEHE